MRVQTKWRGGGRVLVSVVILVVMALGVGATRWLGLWPPGASSSTPHPQAVTVAPGADGLACLGDSAWAPDGGAVAVLGEAQACPTAQTVEPVTLLIYDAHRGALRQRVDVGALIRPGLPAEQQAAPLLAQAVQWRADGQKLAILFATLATTSDAGQSPYAGLGLVVLDGAYAHPQVIYLPLAATSTGFDQHISFDLAGGTATAAPNDTAGLSLALALSYRWQAGALLPDQPLTAGSSPTSAASVSLWQPGTVNRYAQGKPGATFASPVTTWQTRFLAWSPDGQTILAPLQLALRLQLDGQPAPSADALQWLGPIPQGPIRDAGLQQILQHLSQGTDAANVRVPVAWRGDGAVVAAYGEQFGTTVTLYDAATGRSLGTDAPPTAATPLTGGGPELRWAPSGSRLLVAVPDAGTVSIWNV